MTKLEECAMAAFHVDVTDGMFEDANGRDLPKPSWEEMPAWHPRMIAMARAVIRCLMEPNKAMLQAAWHSAADEDCDDHFRTMLQTVLDEADTAPQIAASGHNEI